MKIKFTTSLICFCSMLLFITESKAQISLLQDYVNNNSPAIGTFQGINFREAGFSGLYPIPGTNGKEFWTISDRGVNVDCGSANPAGCTPTYDKMYAFPNYAPKIHRIRIVGSTIQILQTISLKRPNGMPASGIINPTGLGSSATEVASTDTVLTCANFSLKTTPKDTFGIDSEGIVVDKDGNFWICEEGGPTIWKVNSNGVLLKRYTPYANLPGVQSVDIQIDTVFKYRKNNRGFEGICIAPNGKIYTIIQSPVLYPTKSIGEGTRIHRILEIDPVTNITRMFVYLNDGIIGVSGSNQIRLRDWKIGDMAAINDSTFLVLEAAARGTSDIKRLYQININGATAVHSGLYGSVTLEALVDSTGMAAYNLIAVRKTLVMDLLANAWPAAYDKAEGIAIINDSTLAICNDNDFGQTCPLENGIAISTTSLSHLITYRLSGVNKLQNLTPVNINLNPGLTGPSTTQTPYLNPVLPLAKFTSILTAGDTISGGYKMSGIPDGTGAFDNGNGTFTLLVTHEIPSSGGIVRAHGSAGAFVSKWIINKSDLSVISGSDLIKNVNLWSGSGYTTYNSTNPSTLAAFNRFCSADLPVVSAFYNASTGLGTQERIFMTGEEAGDNGRIFAHIATGVNAGTSYELPYLGKFSAENAVASPTPSDKTVVAGTDDSTPGQVYFYIGTKTNTGSEIEKAGLTNGKLFGVKVTGLATEMSTSFPSANTTFSLVDLGIVRDSTGTGINIKSNALGITNFLRPEDGAWDPSNPSDFYFVTTNSFAAPSRLWRLRFTNSANPELGGTITAVLDGTEGQKMFDNITIDNYGHILLQEDIGNNSQIGKIWQYTIATDQLIQIAEHDPTRFVNGGANFLTQDEESSGIIDVQNILGPGMFVAVCQAHYPVAGEVYEGGQLLTFFNPATNLSYLINPEINIQANNVSIADGDMLPSSLDNTDFGKVPSVDTKSFVIQNAGPAALVVSGIYFTGANATDFTLVGNTILPFTVPAGSSQTFKVKLTPGVTGLRTAVINVMCNDFDETVYDFAIQGYGVDPGVTGPTSSQSPYMLPTISGAKFTSILTAGDAIGGYKMCGLADGLGAFDNGNGTFTLLMTHEINNALGIARAHGSNGAFVSKWIINKSNLSVVSGSDLIRNVYLWNGTGYTQYNSSNPSSLAAFNRFCSADLPAVSAFYNATTGMGTQERIFMNGEEAGDNGRLFAHIVTGVNAGKSYELPYLGKFSAENAVASPTPSDKTVVAGTDDSSPGQVYFYVGNKTNTGTEIDRAGLTNGRLYGVAVFGLTLESSASVPAANTLFSLVDLGVVRDSTGTGINAKSNATGVTNFLRPEDGAWDPSNPKDFYFVTTNSFTTPSRLWRLRFYNPSQPELGGTITAVLDGAEGQKMFDNITIDNYGHILLQEDVGNNVHNGKIWQYTISTDGLIQVAEHDASRFISGGANYLTQDEESSGIIDMHSILGPGMFLAVDQAHYSIAGELVEGGQLLSFYNPDTYNSTPEITLYGNNENIVDNDVSPALYDNTDFGAVNVGSSATKSYVIQNTGIGALTISGINLSGGNANDYSLVNPPAFPTTLNGGSSVTINVKVTPSTTGVKTGVLNIISNDFDESLYNVNVQCMGVSPEIEVKGNNVLIADGDVFPSTMDNTDFGKIKIGKVTSATYEIRNTGTADLSISGISISGTNKIDFSLANVPALPFTISAGGSYTVVVNFLPFSSGAKNASLLITTNDLDESLYDFALEGSGAQTEINVLGNGVNITDGGTNPTVIDNTDFGTVNSGSSKTRVFIIQNLGSEELVISAINFSGPNASDFILSGTWIFPIKVPVGGYMNVVVELNATAIGPRFAMLHILNDDDDEQDYEFALQGMVIPATGVATLSGTSSILLYPNPTVDHATLEVELDQDSNIEIAIIDVNGKYVIQPEIRDFSAGQNKVTFNLSKVSSGIYYVRLLKDGSTQYLKLIVSK